jgi:Flp pilus assembly protein TadD
MAGKNRMVHSTLRASLIALVLASATLSFATVQVGKDSLAAKDSFAEAREQLAAGSMTSAESTLRSYLKDHPDSADAHFLLGYTLFREQKATESLAEFTAGAKFRRPGAEELETVASDYVLLEDFADADKWFTEVVAERPTDGHAAYLLGRTKYQEGLYESALSSFDRALVLHPRYVEAEDNRGLALRELNRLDQAETAFQNAIDWQGAQPTNPQPMLNLGALLVVRGDMSKALPVLIKAAILAPQNPTIHEQLGAAYAANNDLPQAQDELRIAVKLAPETSALHYQLGVIYRKQKKMELARQEFDTVSRLNSTHSSHNTPNPYQAAPNPTPNQPK